MGRSQAQNERARAERVAQAESRNGAFVASIGSLANRYNDEVQAERLEDVSNSANNMQAALHGAVKAAGAAKRTNRPSDKMETNRLGALAADERERGTPQPWGELALFNVPEQFQAAQEMYRQDELNYLSNDATSGTDRYPETGIPKDVVNPVLRPGRERGGDKSSGGRPADRSVPGVALDIAPDRDGSTVRRPAAQARAVGEQIAEHAAQGTVPLAYNMSVRLGQDQSGRLWVPRAARPVRPGVMPALSSDEVGQLIEKGAIHETYNPEHLEEYYDWHQHLAHLVSEGVKSPDDIVKEVMARNPHGILSESLFHRLNTGQAWVAPIERRDGESVVEATLRHHRVMHMGAIMRAIQSKPVGQLGMPLAMSGGLGITRPRSIIGANDQAALKIHGTVIDRNLNITHNRRRIRDIQTTLFHAGGVGAVAPRGVRANGGTVSAGGTDFVMAGRQFVPMSRANEVEPDKVDAGDEHFEGFTGNQGGAYAAQLAAKYRRQ